MASTPAPTASSWEEWATALLSPNRYSVAASLLAVFLIPLLLHFLVSWRASTMVEKDTTPTFILMGPLGAGKTKLRCLLEDEQAVETHSPVPTETCVSVDPVKVRCTLALSPSSTSADSSEQPTPKARFTVQDTPGHLKVRRGAFDALRALFPGTQGQLAGIIYVVDSTTFSSAEGSNKDIVAAADYLHEILLTLQKADLKKEVPILIASNKEDLFTACPVEVVSSRLEEEVVAVRERRATGLLQAGEDEDGRGEREELIGGGPDGWGWIEEAGVRIDVRGGNFVGAGQGADDWLEWIREQLRK